MDDSASTRFFTPKVYDGNNAFEVQQLLNDLDSISAGLINVGGDFAEYGMHGIRISRVINAFSISDPDTFSHVLLFTDMSPKDYSIKNKVEDKLLPSDGYPTLHHGFLPRSLSQPCGLVAL